MNDNPLDNSGNFTPSQVGALFESLRGEIRLVAEGHGDLKKDMSDLKKDVGDLKKDVTVIRITLGKTLERVTFIELTQRKMLTTLEGHDIRLARLEEAVLK